MDRVLWLIVGFVMAAIVLVALSSLIDGQFTGFEKTLLDSLSGNLFGG